MSRDHSAAKKFRDVVAAICRAEVEKLLPQDRYAKVESIDTENRRVVVHYNGEPEGNLVTLPYNSVQPAYVGQWVRVGGPAGDRHVIDTLGGTAIEERTEEVRSEAPIYPKWLQTDKAMVDTGMISARPNEFEVLNVGNNVLMGTVLRVPGRMTFSKVIIHLANGGGGQIQLALFRFNGVYDAERIAATSLVTPVYNVDQQVDFQDRVTLDRGDEVLVAILNRTGSTLEVSGWTHKPVRVARAGDALTYQASSMTSMPTQLVNSQWGSRHTDRVLYFSLLQAT